MSKSIIRSFFLVALQSVFVCSSVTAGFRIPQKKKFLLQAQFLAESEINALSQYAFSSTHAEPASNNTPILQKGLTEKSLQSILNLVNTDSIAKTVQDLQNFKTRYVLSGGINQAADYIRRRFQNYFREVDTDRYSFSPQVYTLFFQESTGSVWIGAENGIILRSDDTGETWSLQQQKVDDDIKKIWFVDSTNGWATGAYGHVFRTRDGGRQWQSISILTGYLLDPIVFADSLHSWIGANSIHSGEGQILATRDGGLNWTVQYRTSISCNITDIGIVAKDTLWSVGSAGWAAFTNDGGAAWVQKEISQDQTHFLKIDFIDSRHGWISGKTQNGSGGAIYKTTDGGKIWYNVFSLEGENFDAIDFSSLKHGWTGSFTPDWKGTVFYSKNGGDSWEKKTAVKEPIIGIMAVDSSICMASGYDGHIYRTLDGGETWEALFPKAILQSNENVVAVLRGTANTDSIIVIGAHYDDTGIPNPYEDAVGADDNASGTAAVIELARILSGLKSPCTLEFVAFSGEERGLLGSRHYATDARLASKKIKAMFNFDVVGYTPPGAKWEVNLQGSLDQAWIVELASYMATTYTALIPHPLYPVEGISDHFAFYAEGYTTLFLFERVRNPSMHLGFDTFSNMSIPYAAEIIKTGLATIAGISGIMLEGKTDGFPDSSNQLVLYGNFPNPFNAGTKIRYALPKPSHVKVAIYDIFGKQVRSLVDIKQNAGTNSVTWDGMDGSGHRVSSGVYIYKILADEFTISRKMILMK